MSRIEIPIEEYQGMKTKIKNLENALNSVSKESAVNKERIENLKVLIADLEGEAFFNRLFRWKSIIEPFKELLKINDESKKNA